MGWDKAYMRMLDVGVLEGIATTRFHDSCHESQCSALSASCTEQLYKVIQHFQTLSWTERSVFRNPMIHLQAYIRRRIAKRKVERLRHGCCPHCSSRCLQRHRRSRNSLDSSWLVQCHDTGCPTSDYEMVTHC